MLNHTSKLVKCASELSFVMKTDAICRKGLTQEGDPRRFKDRGALCRPEAWGAQVLVRQDWVRNRGDHFTHRPANLPALGPKYLLRGNSGFGCWQGLEVVVFF